MVYIILTWVIYSVIVLIQLIVAMNQYTNTYKLFDD